MDATLDMPARLDAVARADAIIRLLEERGELDVPTIAEGVGEAVSSTYRLIADLRSIGWVEPGSARGRYRLGLWFMRIGALVEDRLDIREAALPALTDLRATTGATALLLVRRGARAVCLERLEGEDVAPTLRLGDSLPLSVGGAPRALLAWTPRSEQDALIEELGAGESLRRLLTEDRRRGWSVSDGEIAPGIAAIGAPVFNHRGELEAAIQASGLRTHVLASDSRVVAALVLAAETASRALGHSASLDVVRAPEVRP